MSGDRPSQWAVLFDLGLTAPERAYDGLEMKNAGHGDRQLARSRRSRAKAIQAALEAYCERDTSAMVVLKRLAGDG